MSDAVQSRSRPMAETSYPRDRIRITILENVHPAAADALTERGYSVEVIRGDRGVARPWRTVADQGA
jgi:hypothetical protein